MVAHFETYLFLITLALGNDGMLMGLTLGNDSMLMGCTVGVPMLKPHGVEQYVICQSALFSGCQETGVQGGE